MNRKAFYALFILISSAINILFTALIIASLFAIFAVVLHIAKSSPQMYANALFASFTIGIVLSFFLYSKITMKIVKKHKLDERYGNTTFKKTKPESKSITERKTSLSMLELEAQED